MKLPKQQVAVIYFLVGMAVVPFTWWFVYYMWPVDPPIVWKGEHYIKPPVITPGEIAYIHREFDVMYPVSITIERKLIREGLGSTMLVELPQAQAFYDKGEHVQARPFTVPCGMTTGVWNLVNMISFQDGLHRTHYIKPPVIKVRVGGVC